VVLGGSVLCLSVGGRVPLGQWGELVPLFVQGLRCLMVVQETKVLGHVVEMVIVYFPNCQDVRPYGCCHLDQNLFTSDRQGWVDIVDC